MILHTRIGSLCKSLLLGDAVRRRSLRNRLKGNFTIPRRRPEHFDRCYVGQNVPRRSQVSDCVRSRNDGWHFPSVAFSVRGGQQVLSGLSRASQFPFCETRSIVSRVLTVLHGQLEPLFRLGLFFSNCCIWSNCTRLPCRMCASKCARLMR